jgi:hypothetical protein
MKINNMTKTVDNYSAFNEVNLSNARSENESFEDYKKRQKQNIAILKVYNTAGRDNFKSMFPNGILEAIKNSEKESEKVNAEKLGEAK